MYVCICICICICVYVYMYVCVFWMYLKTLPGLEGWATDLANGIWYTHITHRGCRKWLWLSNASRQNCILYIYIYIYIIHTYISRTVGAGSDCDCLVLADEIVYIYIIYIYTHTYISRIAGAGSDCGLSSANRRNCMYTHTHTHTHKFHASWVQDCLVLATEFDTHTHTVYM